jgi:hypothetical protein
MPTDAEALCKLAESFEKLASSIEKAETVEVPAVSSSMDFGSLAKTASGGSAEAEFQSWLFSN